MIRLWILLAAACGLAGFSFGAKIGLVGSFPEGRGDAWQAANLALEEPSKDDALAGAGLEVVDDRENNQAAVKAAAKLAEDPEVLVVVAHGEAAVCPEALAIYRQAGLAVISASSYAGPRPLTGTALWMCPSGEQMAGLAGTYAYQMMRYRQVAAVDDASLTATACASAFSAAFRKAGGKLVYSGVWQGSEWGLTRTSAALKANWPQAVYYAGDALNAARLGSEIKERMKTPADLLGGPFLLEPDFLKTGKQNVQKSVAYFISPSYRMIRRQKLDLTERKAYGGFGTPGNWAPMVFDATRLALKGLAKGGGEGREGVLKAVNELKAYVGIQGKVELGEDRSPNSPKIATFMAWTHKKNRKKMAFIQDSYGPPWNRQR